MNIDKKEIDIYNYKEKTLRYVNGSRTICNVLIVFYSLFIIFVIVLFIAFPGGTGTPFAVTVGVIVMVAIAISLGLFYKYFNYDIILAMETDNDDNVFMISSKKSYCFKTQDLIEIKEGIFGKTLYIQYYDEKKKKMKKYILMNIQKGFSTLENAQIENINRVFYGDRHI